MVERGEPRRPKKGVKRPVEPTPSHRTLSLSLFPPLFSTRGITFLVCPPLPPFSRLPFDAFAGKNNNPLLGPPPSPSSPVAPKRWKNVPLSTLLLCGRAVQKLPTATREANCPPAPSSWKRRDTSRRTKWISSLSLLFREEKGGLQCKRRREEKALLSRVTSYPPLSGDDAHCDSNLSRSRKESAAGQNER